MNSGTVYTETVVHMAPEQFVTGQTSVQSDIFAVGVTLYELLSGRHPFARAEAEELQIVRAIQFADPPPLAFRKPGSPLVASTKKLSMWAPTPTKR